MANKIRATIKTDGVGAFRHGLYVGVLARINQSVEEGKVLFRDIDNNIRKYRNK